MSAIKVLYICQEIVPYLPDSQIATLCRNLPQKIQDKGNEIRTFMPRFGAINERRNQLHEVIRLSGMNLIIDDTDHPLIIKVASIQSARMQIYFIDNDDYFSRKQITRDEQGNDYPDNEERAIFFVRGVIETVKKLRWVPDIVHCHGWFTSLAPLYIKQSFNEDPYFKNAKLVTSLYDESFVTPFSPSFIEKLKIEGVENQHLSSLKESTSAIDLQKLAIDFSDGIIQVGSAVDASLSEYTNSLGKHFMLHPQEEDYSSAYQAFYEKVWS